MVERKLQEVVFHNPGDYELILKEFKEPEEELNKNSNGIREHSNGLLEEYFVYVAHRGQTAYDWSLCRGPFLWKLKTVIEDMLAKDSEKENDENEPLKPMSNKEYYDKLKNDILRHFEAFEAAPFTIQRLAELLIEPTRHYNLVGKFLRAVEKTVNIVTCVNPFGDRIAKLEDDSDEEEEPVHRVENNFIVSVDELDEPVAKKMKVSNDVEPPVEQEETKEKTTEEV
ncbi:unnamed protein product [Bursaphelenchus okinawaensis]|uniref:Uncharacterized protein n=1 Tax=Bursaphelenchus okinawaensis TaxID=465554 RepID=A0A811LI79_9BILA|nr:unnamed protein product [Bursaphelenchus okinawaensis]CAG9126241.1 unnamed protein product [Bursaphelenchus okinawaensis]